MEAAPSSAEHRMSWFARTSRSLGFAFIAGSVAIIGCGGSDSITGPPDGGSGGGGGGGTTPVASVALTPSTATVAIGATTTLAATLHDGSGNVLSGRTIVWASSDESVAGISDAGVVTAKAIGTATITATSEGKEGKAVITVTDPVASVVVSPAAVTLTYFDTTTVSATTLNATGGTLTGRKVTWTSSDTTIAKVDSTGLVSAVGAGTATITATSEQKAGTATITVTKAPVSKIVATPASLTLKVGETQTFTITLLDAGNNKLYGRRIAIQLSNSSLVTVTQDGQTYPVKGLVAGTETLTITAENAPSTTVTVTITS